MKIITDISKQDYIYIAKKHCLPSCGDRTLREAYYEMILRGVPLDEILEKIKREIDQVEINGHIRDIECFIAGLNTASKIIDAYIAESEKV